MKMQQVYNSLPDDQPITGICVVEDPSKCPHGFHVVSKTHDLDSDADLWKEVTFFGRRVQRYLCLSKSENIADFVVHNVFVIGDKEIPGDGVSVIPRTIDGDSKAWRKKQLAYSFKRKSLVTTYVTDIILLAKSKKAPEGFQLAGDICGLTLCYKVCQNNSVGAKSPIANGSALSYGLHPKKPAPPPPVSPVTNGAYPKLPTPKSPAPAPPIPNGGGDYVNLTPIRPAPTPPAQLEAQTKTTSNYGTLSTYSGLEGIPFSINRSLKTIGVLSVISNLKPRSRADIEKEYTYDFRLERQFT